MSETPSFAVAGVIAPHPAAAVAARDSLVEGGNAIEAAVAALAVLSVVLPQAGGGGGDGLWLVREAGSRGRTRVLDARGPVGDAVTLRAFREHGSETIPSCGPQSILTVPGAVAGWRAALELSTALGGRVPARHLLEPAIISAREGFAAPDPALRPLPSHIADEAVLAESFLVEGGLPAAGTRLRALPLADMLAYLAQSGLDDFYRGDVGREIAQDLQALGGFLTRDDFRHFEPRWREPVSLRCGFGLVEVPSSRAGLKLLLSLGILEKLNPARPDSAAHLHGRLEVMKRAEAILDDAQESGRDPGTVLTPAGLLAESLRIDAARAAPTPVARGMTEASLWVGVIDGTGLAVSVSQSIGTAFGSGCQLPKTGLLMGNRGAGFDLDDENGRVLRRGRRSAMQSLPIIIGMNKGEVRSFGASDWRLASSVAAQWLVGAPLAAAIEAPRALPDGLVLTAEEGLDPSVIATLNRAGHEVRSIEPLLAGDANALSRGTGDRLEAIVDPRRDGNTNGF